MKQVIWREEGGILLPFCPHCNEPAYEWKTGKCCFCNKGFEVVKPETEETSDRERLIALIKEAQSIGYDTNPEIFADYLMEHGAGFSPIEKAEQWLNDMENPLEPVKVAAALQSECLKLAIRMQDNPESVSPLDYTIIACLRKEVISQKKG